MKYAPRKVYIKEDGGYTELSYKEFCRRKETDGTYAGKLFIPVQGCLIETEQSHYVEFYRDKERWRYLKKLDTDNSLLSLEAFEDNDDSRIDFIADEAVNVEETIIHKMMLDKLKSALKLLSESEQALIQAMFFEGLSERELAKKEGVNHNAVHKRKIRILTKLKKIIEN